MDREINAFRGKRYLRSTQYIVTLNLNLNTYQ